METNIPKNKEKNPVSANLKENEEILDKRLGMDKSFDVGVRKLNILHTDIQLYFVQGITDTQYIIEQLKGLMHLDYEYEKKRNVNAREAIENHLVHVQVDPVETLDEAVFFLLSGLLFILIEGETEAIVIDVRNYPGRGPEEPDTEKVVRGARDGYTENIIENTGLTRRRIRDERLRNEIMQVGRRSQTDICISYIDGIVDPDLVDIIKEELTAIDIDGLTMSDKVVEEFIVKQGANPFPLVRYTERPDVAATHLLEGHVVVFVDTSPSVIIAPTTFFHHVQHAEEFRQAPTVGTFLRWTRFVGMLLAVFIIPLWLLMALEPTLLPENLGYIGPNETGEIPLFWQFIFAGFGIELLRMAAIHTPSPLVTALGLVAALLIGEVAIEVGLFSAEVVLYVALGAIGIFATPSYELGITLKITRLVLLVAVFLFKVPGLVIATTLLLITITSIKSLNKPYLWPFIPFNPAAFKQILFRMSVPTMKKRPSIVNPKDIIKQS